MSKKEAKTWQQAKLLNAYYIKVAKAAVNQGGDMARKGKG